MPFRILLLIFGTVTSLYCQPAFQSLDEFTHHIQSIDPGDTNFADLQFLKSLLKNKRVVLLGEQEHGDGAAFSAKIRLIKFLNQEMGFRVLAFETPLQKTIKSWNSYQAQAIDLNTLMASALHYKHWAKPIEMSPLSKHIGRGGLALAGIDLSYYGSESEKNRCLQMVESTEARLRIKTNNKFKSALNQLLRDGIKSDPVEKERQAFSEHIDSMIVALDAVPSNPETALVKQELKCLNALGRGWWQNNAHSRKNWWSSQNIRDQQMADNITWLLSKKFAGEKIIVWAANYHVSKFVSDAIQKDRYFQNDNAVPMGEALFKILGDELYSIGICSYTGARTLTDNEFRTTPIKPRSSSTFESYLHDRGHKYAYVDLAQLDPTFSFRMAGLFHYELEGAWGRVFDGLLFIDEMTPLTLK